MIFCVSWDKETKNKPMNEEIYYTYAWLREDRTPYYIMSEAQKGKKHTTESRKKIGEAFKRLAWFYDPVSKATKRCRPEDCPDGYRHGRGQKR
jgi:hypothetical protein